MTQKFKSWVSNRLGVLSGLREEVVHAVGTALDGFSVVQESGVGVVDGGVAIHMILLHDLFQLSWFSHDYQFS